MKHAVFLFAVLLSALLSLPSYAAIRELPFDTMVTVQVSDGDEIRLSGFPEGWGYSRVVLGVNAEAGNVLSGTFTIQNCVYTLAGYYQEVDFSYGGTATILYSGPSRLLPLHWWVDANPVISSCVAETGTTPEDSIRVVIDSLMALHLQNYRDIGALNTEYAFEGAVGQFRITDLPTSSYNLIYVQVVSKDGLPLDGGLYTGLQETTFSGYSQTVALERRTARALLFQLAFPEYRKISIKWWASVTTPTLMTIAASADTLSDGNVSVEYSFQKTPFNRYKSLKLLFDPLDFEDGNFPSYSLYSHSPVGLLYSGDSLSIQGPVYDIHAQLKTGRKVTVALPVDMDSSSLVGNELQILHFNESLNQWEPIIPDSIRGGYAYFQASGFSWYASWWTPACYFTGICAADPGVSTVVTIYDTYTAVQATGADGVISYYFDSFYNILQNVFDVLCPNIKNLVMPQLEKLYSSTQPLDDHVGEVSTVSPPDNQWNDTLNLLSLETLTPLTGVSAEEERWAITKKNMDILLADMIRSKRGENEQPRFILKFNEDGTLKLYVYEMEECILSVSASTVLVPGSLRQRRSVQPRILNFSDYFESFSELFSNTELLVNTAASCVNVTSPVSNSVHLLLNQIRSSIRAASIDNSLETACRAAVGDILAFDYSDLHIDMVDQYVSCVGGAVTILENDILMESLNHTESILQNASDVFNRVALLCWYSMDYRKVLLDKYLGMYGDMQAWVDFASPIYDWNNMSIKALAGLSLYEYMRFGTMENYQNLNKGMNIHFGDKGGFSEGTGYLQYVMEDVPYLLVALRDAYALRNPGASLSISSKFLQAGYYLSSMSRAVNGMFIPLEVDDGCTYSPDFAVWANLLNSDFEALAVHFPLDPHKITPLNFLGLPKVWNGVPFVQFRTAGIPWGSLRDGAALIQVLTSSGDTVALSMIAENENMWMNGQTHDQQDNQSITLTHSKNGFIIQDRGYSGFDKRDEKLFPAFINHNVLATSDVAGGENGNILLEGDDLMNYLSDAVGSDVSRIWGALANLIYSPSLSLSLYGGAPAFITNTLSTEGILGYTSKHQSTGVTVMEKNDQGDYVSVLKNSVTNYRTILYFGGNLWVIDRPDVTGLVWMANTPVSNEWIKVGPKLYGSGTDILGGNGMYAPIVQNGSRTDYFHDIPTDKELLLNYSYTLQDPSATTYTMVYSVDGTEFVKTTDNCLSGVQCFSTVSGDRRLVVPPKGGSIAVSAVFPGFPYTTRGNGIMMGTRTDGAWTLHAIDGLFRSLSGGFIGGSVTQGPDGACYGTSCDAEVLYLPAIPILLLR